MPIITLIVTPQVSTFFYHDCTLLWKSFLSCSYSPLLIGGVLLLHYQKLSSLQHQTEASIQINMFLTQDHCKYIFDMCILYEKYYLSVITTFCFVRHAYFFCMMIFETNANLIHVKGDTKHQNEWKFRVHPHNKRMYLPIW